MKNLFADLPAPMAQLFKARAKQLAKKEKISIRNAKMELSDKCFDFVCYFCERQAGEDFFKCFVVELLNFIRVYKD